MQPLSSEWGFSPQDRWHSWKTRALDLLPTEQRTRDLKERVTSLFCNAHGRRLWEVLQKIPLQQRAGVIKSAVPIFIKPSFPEFRKCHALAFVSLFPERARTQSLFSSLRELLLFCGRDRLLLEIVRALPEEKRQDFIQHIYELRRTSDLRRRLDRLLRIFRLSPKETYGNLGQRMLAICEQVDGLKWPTTFLGGCFFISPEDRDLYQLEFIERVNVELPTPLLPYILRDYPDMLENAKNFLLQSLEEHTTPERARDLANSILRVHTTLGVYEDHPLFQKAFSTYISASPEELLKTDNPYRVYQKLGRRASEHAQIDLSITPERIGEKEFRWNVTCLRQRVRPVRYTRADLPRGVEMEGPDGRKTTLFEVLYRQLQARGGHERIEAVEAFLENSSVRMLLHPVGETISVHTYRLYQIGAALARANRERRAHDSFSEQEEMLVAIAESVQFCSKGVQEAIDIYLSNIPKQGRGELSLGATEGIRSLLDSALYLTMARKFTNLALLEEFGQTVQQPHGSLFLKNLLSECVGYPHKTEFDPSTELLSEKLLECLNDLEAFKGAVYTYFRYLSISSLVKEVQREIDCDWEREPATQRVGLTALASYLSGGENDSTLPLFQQGYVTDESPEGDFSGPFSLTVEGALALLIRANLIEPQT